MSWLRPVLAGLAILLAAGLLLGAFQDRLVGPWLAADDPQLVALLRASRDDQRRLAEARPEAAAEHRARFDELDRVLRRQVVLAHNREPLSARYRAILFAASMLTLGLLVAFAVVRHGRRERRLGRLQEALVALADGRTDVALGRQPADLIGRIAGMVERASRLMARDRRRIAALRNLSAWQEAARRHAHEMRTPLTGARLELARLGDLARDLPAPRAAEVAGVAESVGQELDRLGRFTQAFTSFARLPAPRRETVELGATLATFAETFAEAWPGMRLCVETAGAPACVQVDRDLLRQVLVNLCDNAHHALAGAAGSVRLTVRPGDFHGADRGVAMVEVADDGPGVAPEIRPRLFEPYTTTRGIGEGMGLGLAISRKLMLDQEGDLELVATSRAGTTFRLTLPTLPCSSDVPATSARTDEETA